MIKSVALRELNRRIKEKKKLLEEKDALYDKRLKEIDELDNTIKDCEQEIIGVTEKLEELSDKERKILTKYNPKYDYIIQMEDGDYELVVKEDITIVDDMSVVKKAFDSREDKEITLLQIHFTDIDGDKYNELQEGDWCPFVDLMDYGAHIEIRFYNQSEDKLIQLEWDIPREDVIKLKDLYVKEDSFWMEPTDEEDYSYMALIWNGNV